MKRVYELDRFGSRKMIIEAEQYKFYVECENKTYYEPGSNVKVDFEISINNDSIDEFCDEIYKFVKDFYDKNAF